MADERDDRSAGLVGQVAALTATVAGQAELVAKLTVENIKPAPKSRRRRSGNKPGKQPGDPGRHLAQRPDPDVVRVHTPAACERCGNDLSDAEVTGTVRRQVFDLPPVALLCTEHHA